MVVLKMRFVKHDLQTASVVATAGLYGPRLEFQLWVRGFGLRPFDRLAFSVLTLEPFVACSRFSLRFGLPVACVGHVVVDEP